MKPNYTNLWQPPIQKKTDFPAQQGLCCIAWLFMHCSVLCGWVKGDRRLSGGETVRADTYRPPVTHTQPIYWPLDATRTFSAIGGDPAAIHSATGSNLPIVVAGWKGQIIRNYVLNSEIPLIVWCMRHQCPLQCVHHCICAQPPLLLLQKGSVSAAPRVRKLHTKKNDDPNR
jgi:hypothetical protein